MTALLENALERGFGSDYQLEKDDSGYTIYIWSDGNAMCATLAKSGNAAQKNAWKNIVSTTVEASKTIQDKLVENGYGDYVSVINILNDVDHDYVCVQRRWVRCCMTVQNDVSILLRLTESP